MKTKLAIFIKLFLALVVIFYFHLSFGQQLHVGDTVPDNVIQNIINNDKDEIYLSDFEGKSIILDFWGHGCAACIKAFPKIDSLQQKYEDRLQFILVNREGRDSSLRWLKKRNKISMPAVPAVTAGGGWLSEAFPQQFFPWHVWIDSARVVRYITLGSNATVDNIDAFLDGKKLDVEQLVHNEFEQIDHQTLYDAYEQMVERTLYFSYLAPYDRVGKLVKYHGFNDNLDGRMRISRSMATRKSLFLAAYFYGLHELDFFPDNALILDVSEPERYVEPEQSDKRNLWLLENALTYDLVAPAKNRDEFFEVMQADLQRFFNVTAKREKRLVACYALVRTDNKDRLATEGGTTVKDSLIAFHPARVAYPEVPFLRNCSFEILFLRLKAFVKQKSAFALVDHTGYTGNIDIKISEEALNSPDIYKLADELERYGLRLEKTHDYIDCLVISDKSPN